MEALAFQSELEAETLFSKWGESHIEDSDDMASLIGTSAGHLLPSYQCALKSAESMFDACLMNPSQLGRYSDYVKRLSTASEVIRYCKEFSCSHEEAPVWSMCEGLPGKIILNSNKIELYDFKIRFITPPWKTIIQTELPMFTFESPIATDEPVAPKAGSFIQAKELKYRPEIGNNVYSYLCKLTKGSGVPTCIKPSMVVETRDTSFISDISTSVKTVSIPSEIFMVITNAIQFTKSFHNLLIIKCFGVSTVDTVTWPHFINTFHSMVLDMISNDYGKRAHGFYRSLVYEEIDYIHGEINGRNSLVTRSQFSSFWSRYDRITYLIKANHTFSRLWRHGLFFPYISTQYAERILLKFRVPGIAMIRGCWFGSKDKDPDRVVISFTRVSVTGQIQVFHSIVTDKDWATPRTFSDFLVERRFLTGFLGTGYIKIADLRGGMEDGGEKTKNAKAPVRVVEEFTYSIYSKPMISHATIVGVDTLFKALSKGGGIPKKRAPEAMVVDGITFVEFA